MHANHPNEKKKLSVLTTKKKGKCKEGERETEKFSVKVQCAWSLTEKRLHALKWLNTHKERTKKKICLCSVISAYFKNI